MAGNPLTDPNWAADVTDKIVDTIDQVRAKTTKPIILIARGLVFGLLSAFLGVMALALLLIGVSRALINFIEWPLDHDTAVWVSYFIFGGLLCLIGTVCMIKRQSKDGV
jgi:uncharacterized protein YacL